MSRLEEDLLEVVSTELTSEISANNVEIASEEFQNHNSQGSDIFGEDLVLDQTGLLGIPQEISTDA